MCGICGQLVLDGAGPASEARLRSMLAAMTHRGPDDEGLYCSGPVALGIRRLSIIDVSGGHQPIASEDGALVVVCNGEIYNYVELREELEKRGHHFATHSDVEAIVHLYEEKGPRCVDDLNGMFGFALWDARKQELCLGRDRLGIKPMHYFVGKGMLLFASEIGSIMTSDEVSRDIDAEAVDDYLTYFYIPGTRTVYRDVRRIPAAHTMLWRAGAGAQGTATRYWQVDFSQAGAGKPKPIDYYAEAYREQLKRSCRLQLRSDVPLGIFLSGGLDSGSLVAAIAETTNRTFNTFTIGFEDPSYDESPFAKATAERYGTQHHEYLVRPEDMRATGDLITYFGEPYGPFTMVQGYLLCKHSREKITVALAGDGGDELLGGYQTYLASRMAASYLRLPRFLRTGLIAPLARALPVSDRLLSLDFKIREFVRGAEMFRRAGNAAWKVVYNDSEKEQLLTDDFRREIGDRDPFEYFRSVQALVNGSDLQEAMYCDLSVFLPDCVLMQTDRMSMAVSQEVRVPILDHEMVEFAATVPDRYKIHGGRTKILARHALKPWLPEQVINKPKTGFTTPIPIWIRNELKEYVADILAPSALERTGLFNSACVQRLLDQHNAAKADHARRIWSLVSFMLWYENCHRTSGVSPII